MPSKRAVRVRRMVREWVTKWNRVGQPGAVLLHHTGFGRRRGRPLSESKLCALWLK